MSLNESHLAYTSTLHRNPRAASLPTQLPTSSSSDANSSILHQIPSLPIHKRTNIVVLSGPNQNDLISDGQESVRLTAFQNLEWWHPRLFSTAMFSIATVMALLRMLPYAVVSDVIGPLQISMGSMISKTVHFFFVLTVVMLSIAVGMTYIYSYYNAAEYHVCISRQGQEDCSTGELAK